MSAADSLLLEKIADGDPNALAELHDRYAPRVLALLSRMLARDDAEDVLQEVFWQVWRKATTFDPLRGPPIVWLSVIARTRAIDLLRGKDVVARATAERERYEVPNPGANLELAETVLRASRALACLSDGERSAIELSFFDGLTFEQIALRQQIPLGTIKTRMRRGMQRLRAILQETSEKI